MGSAHPRSDSDHSHSFVPGAHLLEADLDAPGNLRVSGVWPWCVHALAGHRWGGRVNKRLDRAFFRSAYDVRLILENLAEQTRTASDGRQLAMLLERQVRQALHPKTLACYLESGNGRLAVISGALPTTLETLATNTPVLVELARRGKPWELSPSDS